MKMKYQEENQMKNMLNKSLWDLPSPTSMTYFWNFGSTLGICLMIQITTGLLLTFHYTSLSEESFSSIMMIMKETWSGWLFRFMHMNGASMFFMFTYLHLFRGMFYLSAMNKKLWLSGITIMLTLMGISFMGYVLPWGQMSYWAVAVITNLLSVIPMIGKMLVEWVWGGFSVGSPTLSRFYSLHFTLPMILTFMVMIHLMLLHKTGSSNNLGLSSNIDKMQFHPYFTIKDLIYILVTMMVFIMMILLKPYIMGDTVNNIPANPMQTPIHIQPEWYFLTSYAILRSIPSKTAGVIALMASVLVFTLMPAFKLKFSTKFSNFRYSTFWLMIFSFLTLMYLGMMPAEEPYVLMSKLTSMLYFSSILTLNL